MLKNEQLRLLKGLLNHLDAKTNVDAGGIMQTPSDTYTSKERFDLEWQSFFQDYPQIIGMSGDLAEPNSFLTIIWFCCHVRKSIFASNINKNYKYKNKRNKGT